MVQKKKNDIRTEEIQLRSDEVQEVLSIVPNWMIRWGNLLILSLIVLSLVMSWIIKYPDTIVSNITITTVIPPEKLYARSNGQIEALMVSNNQLVSKKDILAVVESTGNFKDILKLRMMLDTLRIDYSNFYFPMEQIPTLFLGPIDSDYAIFETNYADYILNKELKPYSNEILANKLSIAEAKNRLVILLSEQSLNEKEIEIKENDLKRFKTLLDKGAIAQQEYDMKVLDFLQAQRSKASIASSISQLKDIINNSNSTYRSTEIERIRAENQYLKKTIQSFNQLKQSIENWELLYAFKPSINGKVSFSSFLSTNQFIRQGDLVFTIIPENNNSYVGKTFAPQQNSGKIKIGQKVNIRLDNYPFEEYGILQGFVGNVSLVPDAENNYLIEVKLPEQLVTSYSLDIDFKQEMTGTAEIVTEDLRLLERFFYQLKSIFED